MTTESGTRKRGEDALFRRALPPLALAALGTVGQVARRSGARAYLVGGAVRDALLGRKSTDIDVVVEGNAIRLAEALRERAGGETHAHLRFGTAAWTPAAGPTIHLAATRTEKYATEAALPAVGPGSLREDLLRRDFTVNTLAVPLTVTGFGKLVDYCGGVADLRARVLRVLHARSFLDDPTRAFRAARFAAELEFELAAETRALLRGALAAGVFARLSPARLRREIERALEGSAPLAAARRLARERLLVTLEPGLQPRRPTWKRAERAQAALDWHRAACPSERVSRWSVLLATLAEELAPGERSSLAERLRPTRAEREIIDGGPRAARRTLARLGRRGNPVPSQIHAACRGERSEVLLLGLAAAKRAADRRSLALYLTDLRHIRTAITGRELIAAGVPEGEQIALGLEAALRAKLDGEAADPREELRAALSAAGRGGGQA